MHVGSEVNIVKGILVQEEGRSLIGILVGSVVTALSAEWRNISALVSAWEGLDGYPVNQRSEQPVVNHSQLTCCFAGIIIPPSCFSGITILPSCSPSTMIPPCCLAGIITLPLRSLSSRLTPPACRFPSVRFSGCWGHRPFYSKKKTLGGAIKSSRSHNSNLAGEGFDGFVYGRRPLRYFVFRE